MRLEFCEKVTLGRYARCHESKRVEREEDSNVEQMLEQAKRAMVDNAREEYGLVRVVGRYSKNV